MIMFRYYLLVLLSIFTFAQSAQLLTLQDNTHYKLNSSTINNLNHLTDITLTINNQEIDYHTVSYSVASNGSIHWKGNNEVYQTSFSFTLLHNALRGSIELNQEKYILALIPHTSADYQITKVDPSKENKICQKKNYKILNALKKQKSTKESTQTSSTSLPVAALEATTEINVLILYTQQFKDYYGTNTDLTIQHYFDTAKTIYNDSQTNVHLNLIHTELTNNSNFSEDNNISSSLSNLQANTDIHALKQKYHADIVSLFRKYNGTSGVCGLGFLFNNIESIKYFYTVVEIKSSDEGSGSYCPDRTFTHEAGHNFGCAHDRNHASVLPDNDYGYGYDISGEFATVMSYDALPIPYFSNPNLQHNGIDIGVADASDCARNIREKRIYVKQSHALEVGDQVIGNSLNGSLSDRKDKDSFFYKLQGEISFSLPSTASHYIHIYDNNGYLTKTSSSSFSHTFTDGTYEIVSSLTSADNTSYYGGTNITYAIDVTTTSGQIINVHEVFIERFYQNILGRSADTAGLLAWLNILGTESATKVALGFFLSNEFTELALNDNDFVDILYYTLFDRAPDSAGKTVWLTKLSQGTSRQTVMFGFFKSIEFKNLADSFHVRAITDDDLLLENTGGSTSGVDGFVNRFYTLVLNRSADTAGFNFWTTSLNNHTRNGGDIAIGFFNSPEYVQRQLDNSTFIDIAYRAFFGREADAGGKTFWLTRIASGESKDSILNGFIGSQEFSNLTASFGIIP